MGSQVSRILAGREFFHKLAHFAVSFAQTGLVLSLFVDQGGARFTSLVPGYILSGFQPSEFEASSRRLPQIKKLFNLRLHSCVHFDQRRPGTFEASAAKFLRRINAEFAADGNFARGVVEHVGRAFGEDAVPPSLSLRRTGSLRVGVGAEADLHCGYCESLTDSLARRIARGQSHLRNRAPLRWRAVQAQD